MLARHHWANDFHDAGYRSKRMKFPQGLNGYVFKTKASHLDGGHQLWSGMERDGLYHNTRNEEIPMKHPWTLWSTLEKTLEKHLPQKATSSSSVTMKTDMSLELDSSFTKTLWMTSWYADQPPADSLPLSWRHHRLTSPSSKLMAQQLTTMMMTLKTSMINCEKS